MRQNSRDRRPSTWTTCLIAPSTSLLLRLIGFVSALCPQADVTYHLEPYRRRGPSFGWLIFEIYPRRCHTPFATPISLVPRLSDLAQPTTLDASSGRDLTEPWHTVCVFVCKEWKNPQNKPDTHRRRPRTHCWPRFVDRVPPSDDSSSAPRRSLFRLRSGPTGVCCQFATASALARKQHNACVDAADLHLRRP